MGSFLSGAAPFIGRQDELVQIGSLFAHPNCRLLTLVGMGGVGKTRLALEAAHQFHDAQFVPLQPLTSPDFIVSAVADAVDFQFYSGADPKRQLLDYLREKSWLLVLDNFEHLLEGATLLSDMLAAAPAVRLLVTSRERLNLVEEWTLDVDALEQDSAVDLFVQQAQRAKVSFSLTDQNRAAVARICRLVDGMPLALELAASWVRALSCEAIADEIEHSLDILETPVRNVEPRHRTMRAAFEPTWERLTDHERDVFMKLSVFRGGFTREAAREVAGASLGTLSALVDKSLLKVAANGRCDLHELLRQYAAEKLQNTDEADAVADCHLAYFLRLAEQAEAHQYGAEQKMWLDRLGLELDNIRAALAWSLDGGSAEDGLRLVSAIREFWENRGLLPEGLAWSKRLLAVAQDISPLVRMKALCLAGEFATEESDIALSAKALDLARQIGDPRSIAWTLCAYAYFPQTVRGRFDPSTIPLMEESLTVFRQLDDPYGLSHALRRRAVMTLWEKNYVYGRTLAEEALSRAREVGDKNALAWSLNILGEILLRDGHDPGEIAPLFEESMALFRELDDRMGLRVPLGVLGRLEQLAGHSARALSCYEETLVLEADTGCQWRDGHIYGLGGLGTMLEAQGKLEEAARLFAAAQWQGWFNLPLFSQTTFDAHVAAVRARLGEAGFAAAWAEGIAMTWKQAAVYALEQISYLKETLPATPVSQKPLAQLLSIREREILSLIADGLSNGQIAEQLVLAKSTIKWYNGEIFSKLDVTNRTQAVTRARSLGLLS